MAYMARMSNDVLHNGYDAQLVEKCRRHLGAMVIGYWYEVPEIEWGSV